MFGATGERLELKPSGLLIAGVAFVLTRFTVLDALLVGGTGALRAAAQLVPLTLGLGLVAYGVALAVSTRTRAAARRIAGWYLLGSVGMLATVGVGVVAAGYEVATVRTSSVVASALVGGGVGGVLVGWHEARVRRQRRHLTRQTDGAVLLNRLLRHEVLNAVTAIRGHADLLADGGAVGRSRGAVTDGADRIEQTVGDVGFLLDRLTETTPVDGAVRLDEVVRARLDDHEDGDGGTVTVDGPLPAVEVGGDDHLGTVVEELLSVVLERTATDRAQLAVESDRTTGSVTVAAAGDWLSTAEREVLRDGIPEYDAPEVGYGVPVLRLLVEGYGGTVTVREGVAVGNEHGTGITVTLPRAAASGAVPFEGRGLDRRALHTAVVASLVAGVVMGVVLQALTGQLAVVGALYGVRTATVGWVAHLFHSAVFGLLFAAVRARLGPTGRSPAATVGAGVLFGVGLWLVAAGVVMGAWLNLVGVPGPVPRLQPAGLLGHLVWGALLGGLVRLLE